MSSELPDWPRPHFDPGGGDPFLFYVIYGPVPQDSEILRSRFRCAGLPDGIDMVAYGPEQSAEVPASFLDGYLWDELNRTDKGFADAIAEQDECLVLRGNVPDPSDLNYFRDVVGLIEWLFSSGAVGVFDPAAFKWWKAGEWHDRAFETEAGAPHNHVTILQSETDEGDWYHTRGMIKFGRPDLSVHCVTDARREFVVEMLDRFIEMQAFGALVPDGQEIRMAGAPEGMHCRHGGSYDDPDFNNVHIEICWPD